MGLEDENYVKYSLNAIVARGGTIALNVAEVLIQLSQAKSDGCADEFLKADIRDAEGITADLRFTKLERAFGTAQKQAECDLKAAGAKVQAAERRAASAVARIDNMVFRQENSRIRCYEGTGKSRVCGIETERHHNAGRGSRMEITHSVETTDTASRDSSGSRKRSERSALP